MYSEHGKVMKKEGRVSENWCIRLTDGCAESGRESVGETRHQIISKPGQILTKVIILVPESGSLSLEWQTRPNV